jgi:hypothetical protein
VVTQIQEKISGQRKKIVPVLIALSLLSGVLVSLLSTPNAQADYYKGCGYGYNSSAGGFGYGTGFAFGYGYGLNGLFGYGYGSQVCPPPTTTTTLGGGGGGGGGTTTTSASSTTTTTAPTSTTTAPNTTTTAPTKKVCNLFARKVTGYAVLGRSVRFAITGCGFHGQPKITSNGFCTRVGVLHDYGKVLIVRVTVCARSSLGWHTFKIRLANGKSAKVNYRVISGAATKSLK